MKNIQEPEIHYEQPRVLIVGNNPIELHAMITLISSDCEKIIKTETAFDSKTVLSRLLKFRPNFILLDDNVGIKEIVRSVKTLRNNRFTKDVPITILKNTNAELIGLSHYVFDYALKSVLTPEGLYASIRNVLRMKRTRAVFDHAFKLQKSKFTL